MTYQDLIICVIILSKEEEEPLVLTHQDLVSAGTLLALKQTKTT